MIIHINSTLQSYLVPEKKMIIFLKDAGTISANIDMNIQWPHSAPRYGDTPAVPRDSDWSL